MFERCLRISRFLVCGLRQLGNIAAHRLILGERFPLRESRQQRVEDRQFPGRLIAVRAFLASPIREKVFAQVGEQNDQKLFRLRGDLRQRDFPAAHMLGVIG